MPFPEPYAGLVIRYSYLWKREQEAGREDGTKDRPCAVVMAIMDQDGEWEVLVLPITHSPPPDPADAIEIPAETKKRLRLDTDRSWIMITEANEFLWPGRVLAEQHALAPELLDGLAQQIATTHPDCAAGLLRRFVDAVLPRCRPRDYTYLAHQIARILALSPGPNSRAWVNQIRIHYGARRKLISLLDAAMTPGESPSRTRSS